jgi:hypothetical protein
VFCVVSQSPKGGADTSNFDIRARRSDDDEWSVVGRPSWLGSSIPRNVDFFLDRQIFLMPAAEELTLFEPLVDDDLNDIPGALFFHGVGFLFFGVFGFLRFYTFAPWNLAVFSFIAIFMEFVKGNLNIPHADDHVKSVCKNAPSK